MDVNISALQYIKLGYKYSKNVQPFLSKLTFNTNFKILMSTTHLHTISQHQNRQVISILCIWTTAFNFYCNLRMKSVYITVEWLKPQETEIRPIWVQIYNSYTADHLWSGIHLSLTTAHMNSKCKWYIYLESCTVVKQWKVTELVVSYIETFQMTQISSIIRQCVDLIVC